MPFTDLLEGGAPSGVFKSVDEMKAVFAAAGVDLSAPFIGSCGSGATGAVLSLAGYAITGQLVRLEPLTARGPPHCCCVSEDACAAGHRHIVGRCAGCGPARCCGCLVRGPAPWTRLTGWQQQWKQATASAC